MKQKLLNVLIAWLLTLAACTPTTEPVSVTRPAISRTVTAVPPPTSISTPTATFTPVSTVTSGSTITPNPSPTISTPTRTPERIEGWLANENTGYSHPVASGASLFFARDADLWRAQPDGSGIEQLTFGGLFRRDPNDDNIAFLHNPLVSPDGRFITFSNDFDRLYLVDVTGTQPVQELSARSDEVAWSPDSQKMVYLNKQGIVTLLDVAKGELTPLTNQPVFEFGNLVFSPDGRSLAYNCCFIGRESPTIGEIRVITLVNGHEDTVGETWLSVASGPPTLCWISPNEVVTRDKIRLNAPDHCSDPFSVPAISPNKTQEAFLGLLSPDDDVYFRRLIVMNTTTDEILWQRDFEVILRETSWSLDGQQLFVHVSGEESWPRHGTSDDAIYALPADGSGELELILENAVLLNVISAWGTN